MISTIELWMIVSTACGFSAVGGASDGLGDTIEGRSGASEFVVLVRSWDLDGMLVVGDWLASELGRILKEVVGGILLRMGTVPRKRSLTRTGLIWTRRTRNDVGEAMASAGHDVVDAADGGMPWLSTTTSASACWMGTRSARRLDVREHIQTEHRCRSLAVLMLTNGAQPALAVCW